MILVENLILLVTDDLQEILVGVDDPPRHVELDDRLGPSDPLDLPLEIGIDQPLFRNVRRVFDDLEGLAGNIEDRRVRGLDPNLALALADAFDFTGLRLSPAKTGSEIGVRLAFRLGGIDQHAVMAAFDILRLISDSLEEQRVRAKNRAVHRELDHRLG